MAAKRGSSPAPDDLGIPEHPGTSLMDVPDEVMAGAFPVGESEPAPEAELESEAAADPEKETPQAEPEPEEKSETETVADSETKEAEAAPVEEDFDPAAWAEAQNIPADLVKSCKSPLEAASAVARRLRHREALDGRKDAEIAELRKRVAERAAEKPPAENPSDTAEAPPVEAARTEAQVKAEWTPEQRQQFREWQEEAPEQAAAYLFQQQIAPVVTALREENRRETTAIRNEMKAAQEAPREAELEKEYGDFVAAHPEDYDTFIHDGMPILAAAFGLSQTGRDGLPTDVGRVMGTKLENLYAINKLRNTAPKMYGQIVRDMRGGMKYERARKVAELELGVKPADAGKRAEKQVRTARGAAAASAGAGVGAPQPVVRDLKDLPDEYFEGEGG